MHRSTLRPAARALLAGLALVATTGAACNQNRTETGETTATATDTLASEPPTAAMPAGHIEVQHVLIGFQGSVPGKPITRTRAQADSLAHALLERAKAGENFDTMVQQYTDDAYPGIYRLADNGVTPQMPDTYPRNGMVKGFGDAAFPLAVGEVGIAEYDAKASPFGWHIVKRVR